MPLSLETEMPGFTPSPLQRAAIDRIEYFQRKLKEEYGLYVRTAMELEFNVQDRDGRPVMAAIELEKAMEFLKARDPKQFQRVSFENMFEDLSPNNKAQYEITVADAVDLRNSTRAAEYSPAVVAASTYNMREKHLKDMLLCSSCLTSPVAGLEPNFHPHPYPNLATMPGMHAPPTQTSALHVNISLTDSGGNNVFAHSHRLLNHCAESLVQLHKEAALTAIPSEGSVGRIGANESAPCSIGIQFGNSLVKHPVSVSIRRFDSGSPYTHETRLENRLPGADADPFVAMAVTMAGVYEAVQKHGIQPNPKTWPPTPAPNPVMDRTPLFDMNAPVSDKFRTLVDNYTLSPDTREHLRGLLGAPLYDAIAREYAHQSLSV